MTQATNAAKGTDPSRVVLSAEHLGKTYAIGFFRKKVHATTDVTFQVERGEIFGLLGPNGAGKTTTIKIVLGLVKPTTGRAELLGFPVGEVRAKQRLGYLAESPYFYDYLTGRELLVFVAALFGLGRTDARRRAGELLEKVGLARAADLALRRYSKGMLQRVGLAQALINDPEVVILDEPMSGLDPLGRKQVRELIAALRTEGKTVIFSSHILSDVELLADRAAILVRGRTVATGPIDRLVPARLLSTEIVVAEPSDALEAALAEAGHALARVGDNGQLVLGEAVDPGPVIDLLRAQGAKIVSVTPRKESLEDVVVHQATQG